MFRECDLAQLSSAFTRKVALSKLDAGDDDSDGDDNHSGKLLLHRITGLGGEPLSLRGGRAIANLGLVHPGRKARILVTYFS